MAELRPCKSIEDINEMLVESGSKTVLLLKHSTVCPISSNAYAEVAKFAQNNKETPVYIVLVRESRPVSLHLAEITGVTHQSPQIILTG
ncbi:MAG: bacillithiol system redox-active protein YtxJ [bacterium]